ncbi:hypothetical protein HDV00_009468 [Rhizophlyctis rosea]|nr:hypothetical protein HDV00_009468 [Rhizophlyctis rosea]
MVSKSGSFIKEAPLAPFLTNPVDYSTIAKRLTSEHQERYIKLDLCAKYHLTPETALRLANLISDEEFEDEEEGIDALGFVNGFIEEQHQKYPDGSEYLDETPDVEKGVRILIAWGFDATTARHMRESVADEDWITEPLSFWTCSWTTAIEILQSPTYISLRTFPQTQDFGEPNSQSFYVTPSFNAALDSLGKNLYQTPGRNGNRWMGQGAVLVFCVDNAKLNTWPGVVDLGLKEEGWRDLVSRSRRKEAVESPPMIGLMSGPQLANIRAVQRGGNLEEAKALAGPHPTQFHSALKDNVVGRLFRESLAGVVWHTREGALEALSTV